MGVAADSLNLYLFQRRHALPKKRVTVYKFRSPFWQFLEYLITVDCSFLIQRRGRMENQESGIPDSGFDSGFSIRPYDRLVRFHGVIGGLVHPCLR